MGKVSIPYYVVRKGRGYWQPTPAMQALGFRSVPCGVDGPAAWKVAATWNERWQRARRLGTEAIPENKTERVSAEEIESRIVYPRGSLGEAFGRYRRTEQWGRVKRPRTREDWWRAWKHIRPYWGDVSPSTVTLELIDQWRAKVELEAGRREAHRAMKIWRALWKVAAALGYCSRDADPSLAVRNQTATGRSQTWSEGEVVRLVKQGWRGGLRGLAAALAVMWDSQLSPGDVRALTAAQIGAAKSGHLVLTERGKTDVPVGGILSPRTSAVVQAYLDGFGATLMPDQPVFRTRGYSPGVKGGKPHAPAPYTSNSMGEDFREVRTAVFGAGEKRQMLDIRRSGAVEAIAGGAAAEPLSHAMGNTLSASNELYRTYVPINRTTLQTVAEARRKGRAKMRDREQ